MEGSCGILQAERQDPARRIRGMLLWEENQRHVAMVLIWLGEAYAPYMCEN